MLTETDIKNLMIFLRRINLTGEEAVTFVQLQGKLANMMTTAKPEKETVDKKTDGNKKEERTGKLNKEK